MTTISGSVRRRICIIAPFVYPLFDKSCDSPIVGGAELQLFLLANELVRRGHEMHIIVDDFNQPDITRFEAITLQGSYAPLGMAKFDDVLTPEQAHAIHAYLVRDQIKLRAEEQAAVRQAPSPDRKK